MLTEQEIQDVEASAYAKYVMKKGPAVIAHELDRLQDKIAKLQRMATPGSFAYQILFKE